MLVSPESGKAMAVTAKRCTSEQRERQLAGQIDEDVAYYERRGGVQALFVLVCDPEGLLVEPRELERGWSKPAASPDVRCVIAV